MRVSQRRLAARPIGIAPSPVAPLLMAPTEVLKLRPDIHQAAMILAANSSLTDSATAEIFPDFSLGGFYGIGKSVEYAPGRLWSIALDTAISLIDFGRIRGHIDAAEARQMQAYELYRKSVIGAVAEVETALVDYSRIRERRMSLQKAYDHSSVAWSEAQLLFDNGMISFLDVLDAQRNLQSAETTLVEAKVSQTDSLIRLHKALGVY